MRNSLAGGVLLVVPLPSCGLDSMPGFCPPNGNPGIPDTKLFSPIALMKVLPQLRHTWLGMLVTIAIRSGSSRSLLPRSCS